MNSLTLWKTNTANKILVLCSKYKDGLYIRYQQHESVSQGGGAIKTVPKDFMTSRKENEIEKQNRPENWCKYGICSEMLTPLYFMSPSLFCSQEQKN